MSEISLLGRKAMEEARRGDFDAALSTAQKAIEQDPADKGLRFFAGLLHSRRSEFDDAAAQFREALALAPDDPAPRAELIRVLGAAGKIEEAKQLLDHPGFPEREGRRLRAMLCARAGDHEAAVELYRRIVNDEARDFESWGNLGVSLLASGDPAEAVPAFDRALELRPWHPPVLQKWADAHLAAGTAEGALSKLRAPGSGGPAALIAIARLEDLLQRPGRAIDALQQALADDPSNPAALVSLADLQERANRLDDFEATLERLEQSAPSADKLPLLRARAAYRRGDLDEARQRAEAMAAAIDPAAAAQLIGEINDRIGNAGRAFQAFAEMNRIDGLAVTDAATKSSRFTATVNARAALLTADWPAGRVTVAGPQEREPAFVVGFPRSGTTLLDTLLANDPEVAVSEENPMLPNVSQAIGAFERIADLGPDDIAQLRKLYFQEAAKFVPGLDGRLLIDKFPFGIGAGPMIHRLFPDSRIIFMCRHPCDVVLSCFMTRFQPTDLGSAFLSLEGAARLYDAMMQLWTRSTSLLPLRVHEVRYESLIEDSRAQMQAVAAFLGIAWSEELLDNRSAAQRRGFINTPSYSQVAEPIYRRAIERWRRYSAELQPVLPILEPWARRFGYEL